MIIHTKVTNKQPAFIYAEHNVLARDVRRVWSKEGSRLKSNAAGAVGPARKLSTKDVLQVFRRVDVKNIIISRNNSILLVETFDVPGNCFVSFLHGLNAIFIKPDRKLALDRAPHPLYAALCLRRPRQDLMDVELFTDTLPLGAFFMHNLQLLPLGKIFSFRRMTEDSSTIGINLPRHAIGSAGLPQDFQVAVKTLELGKVQTGDFSSSVVNTTGKAIALVVTKLIEPGERSTVDLQKITFAVAPETRPVHFLLSFYTVSFRRDQAVVLHNFSKRSKRNVDTFKLREAPAEVRKIDVGIMP